MLKLSTSSFVSIDLLFSLSWLHKFGRLFQQAVRGQHSYSTLKAIDNGGTVDPLFAFSLLFIRSSRSI